MDWWMDGLVDRWIGVWMDWCLDGLVGGCMDSGSKIGVKIQGPPGPLEKKF